jgi:uncharacterized membrane protein
MTDAAIYAGAAAMGAVAGLRSSAAPAVIKQLAEAPVRQDEFGLLSRPITEYAATALAAAEIAAEKMSLMPKRKEADSLAARAISGATAGAAICAAKKRASLLGALLGALGAIGISYAEYGLRRRAIQIPETLITIIEDAIAAGVGILILSKLNPEAGPASSQL